MMKRCSPETQGTVIRSGSIELLPDENLVKKDGQYLTLTANEQKLLSYFMQNPMHILSKNQLLETIWDINGNFVDENTLAVNIRRLREKIYSLLHRSALRLCGGRLFEISAETAPEIGSPFGGKGPYRNPCHRYLPPAEDAALRAENLLLDLPGGRYRDREKGIQPDL